MKTSKKILIAAAAVVVAAAVICVLVFTLGRQKAQPLGDNAEDTALVGYSWDYVIAQAPYTDACVFETPFGLERYWQQNWRGGSAIEAVLQQTKDGELVVLSETLPGRSNAEILYGADKGVGDLTLQELKKLNLAYNFEDADGMMTFKATSDVLSTELTVLTAEEFITYFAAPQRSMTARLYFRFLDESAIADPAAAVAKLYETLQTLDMVESSVFCPASDATQALLDEKYPEWSRTATQTEAKALAKAARSGQTQSDLPYNTVLVPAEGRYVTEQFLHYARNCGLFVFLEGASAEDAATLYARGASGLATGDVAQFIQILDDAESAAQEAESTTN